MKKFIKTILFFMLFAAISCGEKDPVPTSPDGAGGGPRTFQLRIQNSTSQTITYFDVYHTLPNGSDYRSTRVVNGVAILPGAYSSYVTIEADTTGHYVQVIMKQMSAAFSIDGIKTSSTVNDYLPDSSSGVEPDNAKSTIRITSSSGDFGYSISCIPG